MAKEMKTKGTPKAAKNGKKNNAKALKVVKPEAPKFVPQNIVRISGIVSQYGLKVVKEKGFIALTLGHVMGYKTQKNEEGKSVLVRENGRLVVTSYLNMPCKGTEALVEGITGLKAGDRVILTGFLQPRTRKVVNKETGEERTYNENQLVIIDAEQYLGSEKMPSVNEFTMTGFICNNRHFPANAEEEGPGIDRFSICHPNSRKKADGSYEPIQTLFVNAVAYPKTKTEDIDRGLIEDKQLVLAKGSMKPAKVWENKAGDKIYGIDYSVNSMEAFAYDRKDQAAAEAATAEAVPAEAEALAEEAAA